VRSEGLIFSEHFAAEGTPRCGERSSRLTQIPPVQQIPGARIVIVEGMAEEVAMAERLAAEIGRN
jgi:hypothetical protein